MIYLVAFSLSMPNIAVFAGEFDIVTRHQARAYILLTDNADNIEKEAAKDLQWAVQKAADVTLEIVEKAIDGAELIPIRIGLKAVGEDNRLYKSGGGDWDKLSYDGGIIEVTPDGINIAGPTPVGTSNAVATILMEDIGIRTYYPHPLFTIAPEVETITIRSRTANPCFYYRVWSGITGENSGDYMRRNRIVSGSTPVPYFGFGHNLANIISVEKYGETHPEYFALIDGVRKLNVRGADLTAQPCFTNPQVIALTIKAAEEFFDKNPQQNTFSVCVNDNAGFCECENCSAMDKPYREPAVGRQYSESYYYYVCEVAQAIARSRPGKYLGLYAYWNVEQPPRNREKLPDNVIPALTLDILQHYDPAYKDKDDQLLKAWAKYVEHLHVYVYYSLGLYTPRTSPSLVAEHIRFSAKNGVRAIFCEVYPFWAWCGPMHYVAARVQWNVNEDVEQILKEFHEDCFKEVAGEMRAYHDTCEKYWTMPRTARWFEGLGCLHHEEKMADLNILYEAQEHLEKALRQAKNPLVKQRVEWLKNGFDFTMAVAQAFKAKRSTAQPEQKLREIIAAAEKVEQTQSIIAADVAYQHLYYLPGEKFNNQCWKWFESRVIQPTMEQYQKELREKYERAKALEQWEKFIDQSTLKTLAARHDWKLKFE